MSGPKVVRIVTEEEKIAICETQVASLSSAISSFIAFLEQNDLATDEIKNKYRDKLAYYKNLATPENYQRIPALVQREIDYIQSEKERFADARISEATIRAKAIRNLAESIKTLEMISKSANVEIDDDINLTHSQINRLNGDQLEALKNNIAERLSELQSARKASQTKVPLKEEHQEVRARLQHDSSVQSFSEWKLFQVSTEKTSGEDNRFDVALAELAAIDLADEAKNEFFSRLDNVYSETSVTRRKLKLDSLMLDIAKTVRDHRKEITLLDKLSLIKEKLLILENREAYDLVGQIEKAMSMGGNQALENMLVAAEGRVERIIRAISITKGKEALINALSALGYQVIEGMQTAIVENGQLIVKKPAQDTYGVELQPIASTGRFQLRMVSGIPDNQRSTSEDASEETAWCNDLAQIREVLADVGVELEIEKALDPGAVPVKHSQFMADLVERTRQRIDTSGRTFSNE